jgi:hypothetical protein
MGLWPLAKTFFFFCVFFSAIFTFYRAAAGWIQTLDLTVNHRELYHRATTASGEPLAKDSSTVAAEIA